MRSVVLSKLVQRFSPDDTIQLASKTAVSEAKTATDSIEIKEQDKVGETDSICNDKEQVCYCKKCGAKLPKGRDFCYKCGAAIPR